MKREVPAVRVAFGELSQALVQLIAAAPYLAQGRLVFQCPMAPGCQKWVQAGKKLEKQMLACGMKSDWKP